jgi:hypothetical protein
MEYHEASLCPEGTENQSALKRPRQDLALEGSQDVEPTGNGLKDITTTNEWTDIEAGYEKI